MATFFLDSNVIVKYYVTEPGSEWVRSLVNDAQNSFLISEITVVEVAAALSQLYRAKEFSRKHMRWTFDRFQKDLHNGLFLAHPVDVNTLERAAEIALTHAIKGYDAVQVASAALAEELSNIAVTFVSGDNQALRTARFEALEVDNPFDHVGDEEASGEA